MTIQQKVREQLRSAIKEFFDIEVAEFSGEVPPRSELGDLAFPAAFDLAKRLKAATGQKQNPRDIATRLADRLRSLPGVARVDVAGAGYINVYFDRAAYVLNLLGDTAPPAPLLGGKIIVEHTAVNPNKATHVGHLRNAVLGDTTVRLLRAAGETVEVQNYIDNTGVQVADVVVGFRNIEGKTLDDIKSIEGKFDYYCWDLYARAGQFYEEDRSRLQLRAEALHAIESGQGEIYEIAEFIAMKILHCHLQTFLRVGVKYELLPRESDVLHLKLWSRAFDLLKARGAVEFVSEGKLAGCWVMRAVEEAGGEESTEHEADKVIVRSNGTVTYTGKDIAFHLWKLGQLDLDFFYRPFQSYPDGSVAWITTSDVAENDPTHPRFGSAAAYFNVIDISQSYPQHYVKLGVMAVDHDERVERSAHLGYEKVTLSLATAEQLGQPVSEEDRSRGTVAMSGRKGLGVKTDDLIDQLEASALVEVHKRNPELGEAEQLDAAHKIAIGALRYFLLKYTRTSMIAFDFKEALAFEGETGPYVQYAVARSNSIFRKLESQGVQVKALAADGVSPARINELLSGENGDEIWTLLYQASRLDEVIRGAVLSLEPASIAKWVFQIAQRFSLFYHRYHILTEADRDRQALLVTVTAMVRDRLIGALDVLGIQAPDRM